jgi:hypothetical protein
MREGQDLYQRLGIDEDGFHEIFTEETSKLPTR